MRLLLLPLLIAFSLISQAQADSIYGLMSTGLHARSKLTKIDPFDGGYRVVSENNLYFEPSGSGGMPHAFIEPEQNWYMITAQVGGSGPDSLQFSNDFVLYCIDIETGDSAKIEVLPERAVSLEYYCEHQLFYGIKTNSGWSQVELFSFDPINGTTNVISPSPIQINPGMLQGYTQQFPVLDPVNNQYVFYGLDPQFNIMLYKIDLSSGLLTSSMLVDYPDEIHQMVFNHLDSLTYALKVNYSPNERSLVTTDHSDLSWNLVSSLPSNIWYNLRTAPIISTTHRSYIFTGMDSTQSGAYLYAYNIANVALYTSQIPGNDSLNYLAAWRECDYNSVPERTDNIFEIHPNPANDHVTINLSSVEKSTLSIFDPTGRLIQSQVNAHWPYNMNISHLREGIYWIQVIQEDQVYSKKLIISK